MRYAVKSKRHQSGEVEVFVFQCREDQRSEAHLTEECCEYIDIFDTQEAADQYRDIAMMI